MKMENLLSVCLFVRPPVRPSICLLVQLQHLHLQLHMNKCLYFYMANFCKKQQQEECCGPSLIAVHLTIIYKSIDKWKPA